MSLIKSKNTKLENEFHKLLKSRKLGPLFKNYEKLPGKPDVISKSAKVAIFIDSCFWHGCKKHLRMPKTNLDYWVIKIGRNIHRDKKVNIELKDAGWSVIRIWEHTLKGKKTIERALDRIENTIKKINSGN